MQPLRPQAVAVAVLRGRGNETRTLLLLRAKGRFAGSWSLVTGRMESGESTVDAAFREVAEETGLTRLALYTVDYCDVFYDAIKDAIQVIPIFVARVADDAIVQLNSENADHRWIDLLEAAEIVPFIGHRVALREIHRQFVLREPPDWMFIGTSSTPFTARSEG